MIRMLFILTILSACQSTGQDDIKTYDPRRQSIEVGKMHISAEWRPEMAASSKSNPMDAADYVQFRVRFRGHDARNMGSEQLRYINFGICNDFALFSNRELITPAICQKIETGEPMVHEYLLAFAEKNTEKQQLVKLLYNDQIFTVGQIAFVFDRTEISGSIATVYE